MTGEQVRGYDQVPAIDATRPQIITCVGRKGSGKSVAARALFTDWPADKVAVDLTGDADPGPDAVVIEPPFATRLPAPRDDGRPHVLHAKIDAGDPAYREHLDQAAALALYPQTRPALVWYDEFGLNGGPNEVGPNVNRLLMASRHHLSSAILCAQRPLNIPVLTIGQSDYVLVYELPSPADRKRIADNIGWPADRFSDEMNETKRRGPHWYLRWDTRANELVRCPPLPYTPGPSDKPS